MSLSSSRLATRAAPLFVILLLAILASTCFVDARFRNSTIYYDVEQDTRDRDSYYAPIKDNLRYDILHELLEYTHHARPSYDTSRKKYLYPLVDRRENGRLHGIYSNITFVESSTGYNCEHSVPQSWFQAKEPMRGDLHHLFTEEMRCNGFRSNYVWADHSAQIPLRGKQELAECGVLLEVDSGGGGVGRNADVLFFQPDKEYSKAAVARAFFYFITRYPGTVSRSNVPAPILTLFREWAQRDVLLWERHRNAEIFKVQGNRNPFIDYPFLAKMIDFDRALKY